MRLTLFLVVLTVLSCSAFAEDGINLPGDDYSDFSAPTLNSCRDTCAGESECRAYTWVKPGIQGASGHCWLKSALPARVKDTCCISGSREAIKEASVKAEARINRPGLDFKNFPTKGWQTCESACTENTTCKSWTYTLAGVQGPTGHCWLKKGVARPLPDANMASGVKYTPPSSSF
jgi:hypothetical protein